MKTILFLTLVLIFVAQAINAQDEQPHSLIHTKLISKIEAFIFLSPENKTSIDSQLITTEYFNGLGYRTKIEIFDSTGLLNSYEYLYKDDSIRIERLTYFKNVLHSKTKIYYNKKGQEIEADDYSATGNKTGTRSKSKYNANDQLKELKFWFDGKLSIKEKYTYGPDGWPVEVFQTLPQKSIRKYTKDQSWSNLDYIDQKGIKMKIKKTTFDVPKTILGLAGAVGLKGGDELETRRFYKDNGLLDAEEQYKNGIFLARKKYKYFP
jgi:hypothetical protein